MRWFGLLVAVAVGGCDDAVVAECTTTGTEGSRILMCRGDPELSVEGMASLRGTVSNAVTGTWIENATVTVTPDAGAVDRGLEGTFSGMVPIGTYTLTFSAPSFESITATTRLVSTLTLKVALMPTTDVIVTASATWSPAGIILHAEGENLGLASGETFEWCQISGPPATITSPRAAFTRVVFPSDAEQGGMFRVTVTMDDGKTYSDDVEVYPGTARVTPR